MRTRVSSMLTLSAVTSLLLASACGPLSTSPPAPDSDTVAILVIDDFDVPEPSKKRKDASDTENCVVTSMPAQVAGGHGASGSPPPPNTSHGRLVFNDIEQELTGAHLTQVAQADPWWHSRRDYGADKLWVKEFQIWRRGSTGAPAIVVVGVDTDEYRTTEVRNYVKDLTKFMEMPPGPSSPDTSPARIVRFVLNMSFQVVPCEFLTGSAEIGREELRLAYYRELTEALQLRDLKTKADLLATAPADGLKQKLDELGNTIKPHLDQNRGDVAKSLTNSERAKKDPLLKFLNDAVADRDMRVIPVAAAGNGLGDEHQPLSFPFAPAIWDSVVSVSAEDPGSPGVSDRRAYYSNSGEIQLSGVLNYPGWDPPLEGTSFAAPRLSVREAFYLLNGGSVRCNGNPDSIPPLGYNGPPGTPDTWLNRVPADAGQYCTDFARLQQVSP